MELRARCGAWTLGPRAFRVEADPASSKEPAAVWRSLLERAGVEAAARVGRALGLAAD